jgi:hypothetical protein
VTGDFEIVGRKQDDFSELNLAAKKTAGSDNLQRRWT